MALAEHNVFAVYNISITPARGDSFRHLVHHVSAFYLVQCYYKIENSKVKKQVVVPTCRFQNPTIKPSIHPLLDCGIKTPMLRIQQARR